jgi:hypothetical protein
MSYSAMNSAALRLEKSLKYRISSMFRFCQPQSRREQGVFRRETGKKTFPIDA